MKWSKDIRIDKKIEYELWTTCQRLRMEAEVPWNFNVTSYVFDIHN